MKTLLLGLLALAAAPAVRADDVQQPAARQEQIREESRALMTRLGDILSEYQRNGLAGGADSQTLTAVRTALGSLTEQEMGEVVAILRKASGDPGQLARAFATQKDISLRLKQIVSDHQRRQNLEAIARSVRQLAERQSANLSVAIDAGQLAAQDPSANGQAAVAASRQAQQSEEDAIAGEVKLAASQLGTVAAEPDQKQAAAELGGISSKAADASLALAFGKMDTAVEAEKTTREKLQEVAAALAPANSPPAPKNDQQADKLSDLVREQRDLLAQTQRVGAALQRAMEAAAVDNSGEATASNSPGSAPLEAAPNSQKKAPDEQRAVTAKNQQNLQTEMSALSTAQAALTAKAQAVRESLAKMSKAASAPMANALTQMNSAQEALAETDSDQAAQEETDAANQLEQAEHLAEQDIPPAETDQPVQTGHGQQLKDLLNGVRNLAARESESLRQDDAHRTGALAQPAAAVQQDLASRAQALKQAAADQASPAAQPLQQASDALQSAAQAIQTGALQQATAAQQSALQHLASAGQQIEQQAAAGDREKQQLAAMDQQMAGIDSLIRQQEQIGMETARAADSQATPPGQAKQLARRQADLRQAAQAARKALETGTPDAAKPLDHADTAMGQAAEKLAGAATADARSAQRDALASLYKAQDALADHMQKVAQDLGQPEGKGEAAAEAALAQAARETASARSALAAARAGVPMRREASQLMAAAHSAAQAGANPQALSQPAREAIRSASEALADAAAAAAAGERPDAQADAAGANKDIAQAQAAMDAAKSGIAGLVPENGVRRPAARRGEQPAAQRRERPAGPDLERSESHRCE